MCSSDASEDAFGIRSLDPFSCLLGRATNNAQFYNS